MIVSFCPGRVRLRFAELKNPTVSGEVVARIQAVTGITKAEVNQRTGSLLVEYDTKVLPTEKLLEMSKTAGFDIFLK
jgi:copper chaperone CopZ